MDAYLTAYIALVLLYQAAEPIAMLWTRAFTRRPARGTAAWLILVPYWMVLLLPLLEHLSPDARPPGMIDLLLGTILFLGAIVVRVHAYVDLGRQLVLFQQRGQTMGLVTIGLYAHIRHPLYLGHLLFFLACPTFLAARWSWAAVALGFVGVLLRVEQEERLLRRSFDGYAAYAETTWRLIPHLY